MLRLRLTCKPLTNHVSTLQEVYQRTFLRQLVSRPLSGSEVPALQTSGAEARAGYDRLRPVALTGLVVLLVVVILVGLGVGPIPIPAWRIAADVLPDGLTGHLPRLSERDQAVVWQLRAPRVIIAGLVGAALAMAGATYQAVFANPLADPYLLGVAAGAGLGVTVAVVTVNSPTSATIPLAAFAGAGLASALTVALGRSRRGGLPAPASLLLAGVSVTALLTAAQTLLQHQHVDQLQRIYSFILGGFGGASWPLAGMLAPYLAVGAGVLLACGRLLDVLALGDDQARCLGVPARRVRLLVIAAATVLTGAAVAAGGLIGFIGIIVPHALRLLLGVGSTRVLLPLCALAGAAFTIAADTAARTTLSPAEIPIGVVTALVGAPFFLLVLRRHVGV